VPADGAADPPRQATLRTLALPLSFLIFGLGFAGIVLRRERWARHDLIAGTPVICARDARAARLRFLATGNAPVRRPSGAHPAVSPTPGDATQS
jgi:hypothetical protein